MPMDFSDEKLEIHAKIVGFRQKSGDESIADYRAALADHMQSIDPVEAQEIRCGKGWDQWASFDFDEVVKKSPETLSGNPLIISRIYGRKHEKA